MPMPNFSRDQIIRTETVTLPDGRVVKHAFVKLTKEQKAYNLKARAEALAEFPPPKKRAKKAGARKRLEIIVTDNDGPLIAAIDKYATDNNLPNRGAVLRVAIARLVGLELPIPHHGWQPGRPRKAPAAKKPATKG